MVVVEDIERHRRSLIGLAYRMLGSVADAEDIVQEAFLRWRAAGEPELGSSRAWLTQTCTRLCLDELKSARHRREQYVGEWLPEPILPEKEDPLDLDETLSMALLMTVQRLGPAERAAFLLHDVFGYTFKEVAAILDLSAANCRQLASRARRRLRGESSEQKPPDQTTIQRLSDAFFSALDHGDLQRIQSVLAEDVVLVTDGGGKAVAARHPIRGVDAVARFFHRIFANGSSNYTTEPRWFNGRPGVVVSQEGRPVSAFHFQVSDDQIQGIYVQRNPDKLKRVAEHP